MVDNKKPSVSYAMPPMITIDGKNGYFFLDHIFVDENKRFGAMKSFAPPLAAGT